MGTGSGQRVRLHQDLPGIRALPQGLRDLRGPLRRREPRAPLIPLIVWHYHVSTHWPFA